MYVIPETTPLSQNMAWQGRRYKSKNYKDYEKVINAHLQKLAIPKIKPGIPFYLYIEFGISARMDCSNGLKLFEDILCRHMQTDDRNVMGIFLRKVITKRSDHYIKFGIYLDEYSMIRAINDEVWIWRKDGYINQSWVW